MSPLHVCGVPLRGAELAMWLIAPKVRTCAKSPLLSLEALQVGAITESMQAVPACIDCKLDSNALLEKSHFVLCMESCLD